LALSLFGFGSKIASRRFSSQAWASFMIRMRQIQVVQEMTKSQAKARVRGYMLVVYTKRGKRKTARVGG
jgi:hypothetical protein